MPESHNLLPQNLGALGVPRKIEAPEPDIQTIWDTTYPVIATYQRFCRLTGLQFFGGGSMRDQGHLPGRITSAYRSESLGGNVNSPHRFALALDIAIESDDDLPMLAKHAETLYTRMGIYRGRKFIHVDIVPRIWVRQHGKAICWISEPDKPTRLFPNWEAFQAAIGA